MSVTLSYMFRKPMTTQYPDRDAACRCSQTIPARYRGFLEVDMDICTACQACERACPIHVIDIEIEKGDGKIRPSCGWSRFDIDIGKCMYCGLCVEPCPTGAIQHTREFEGAVDALPQSGPAVRAGPAGPGGAIQAGQGSDRLPPPRCWERSPAS